MKNQLILKYSEEINRYYNKKYMISTKSSAHSIRSTNAVKTQQVSLMRMKSADKIEDIISTFERLEAEGLRILQKPIRNAFDLKTLVYFLTTFESFMHLISECEDMLNILHEFAIACSLVDFPIGSLIYQTNDPSNNLYIVSTGEVICLNHSQLAINMTENEYLQYLVKLYVLNEIELLIQNVIINSKSIPIGAQDFLFLLNGCRNKKLISLGDDEKFCLEQTVHNSTSISQRMSTYLTGKSLRITNNEALQAYINTLIERKKALVNNFDEYTSLIEPELYKDCANSNETYILLHRDDPQYRHDPDKRYRLKLLTYAIYCKFKRGDYFGNQELLNNENRKTTMLCSSNVRLLVLSNKNFNKIIKPILEVKIVTKFANLYHISLFNSLNQSYIRETLLKNTCLITFHKGDFIINHREELNSVYFINSGEVAVTCSISLYNMISILKDFTGDNSFFHKEIVQIKFDDKFKKFMYETQNLKLSTICNRALIGLEEIVYNKTIENENSNTLTLGSNKERQVTFSLFDFAVVSANCELIKIERDSLISNLLKKYITRTNYEEFKLYRKKHLTNLLTHILSTRISYYHQTNSVFKLSSNLMTEADKPKNDQVQKFHMGNHEVRLVKKKVDDLSFVSTLIYKNTANEIISKAQKMNLKTQGSLSLDFSTDCIKKFKMKESLNLKTHKKRIHTEFFTNVSTSKSQARLSTNYHPARDCISASLLRSNADESIPKSAATSKAKINIKPNTFINLEKLDNSHNNFHRLKVKVAKPINSVNFNYSTRKEFERKSFDPEYVKEIKESMSSGKMKVPAKKELITQSTFYSNYLTTSKKLNSNQSQAGSKSILETPLTSMANTNTNFNKKPLSMSSTDLNFFSSHTNEPQVLHSSTPAKCIRSGFISNIKKNSFNKKLHSKNLVINLLLPDSLMQLETSTNLKLNKCKI